MRRASHAAAAYTLITLAATWPLARGLARDVAWDLGDSVLNMWILSWNCEQLLRLLRGELSRLATFFDGNIFHPAPLTLAYSEHLLPQAVQMLPIYALTGNPILGYNLLFLSTYVLSGLGAYLLVRELTGNALAAFVAGLLFAFAPFRLAHASHLQVLSAQWMPFALYGLRRYFDGGRRLTLAGAAAAIVVQGLSCGYYLLYFTPFAAAYALWEIVQRGLWRARRVWAELGAAGAAAAVVTLPFLLPYAEVTRRFSMERSLTEVTRLSADVYSYATISVAQPLWGGVIEAFPKAEGQLFPGFVPLVLAIVGVLFVRLKAEATNMDAEESGRRSWQRSLVTILSVVAIAHAALAVQTIVQRRVVIDLGPITIRASDVDRLLLLATASFALVLLLSPAARARTAALLRERGFFLAALLAAAWLSLGPAPQALGRPLDLAAPYRLLYEYVPGFQGLRVPARFGMIVALMLAVLGGYGAAALARRRWGARAVVAMAAFFLLEGTAVPFLVNGVTPPPGYATPEPRLYRPSRAPRVYTDGVRALGDAVLAELPIGTTDYDLRAMFYSTVHWRPILNGYSGFFPAHYALLVSALSDVPRRPDVALRALRTAGATHVLVHEGAYLGSEGAETSAALRTVGAVELYRDGADVLLELPHE